MFAARSYLSEAAFSPSPKATSPQSSFAGVSLSTADVQKLTTSHVGAARLGWEAVHMFSNSAWAEKMLFQILQITRNKKK